MIDLDRIEADARKAETTLAPSLGSPAQGQISIPVPDVLAMVSAIRAAQPPNACGTQVTPVRNATVFSVSSSQGSPRVVGNEPFALLCLQDDIKDSDPEWIEVWKHIIRDGYEASAHLVKRYIRPAEETVRISGEPVHRREN